MLRPTFLGFETAKRGLQVSQKGIDISGQNLTNWDSAGYTRQRVDQVAIAPGAYSSRYGSNRIGVAGQGVDITGIAQVRDSFLDKRFREECGDMGYFSSANTVLADIESALGEFQPENDVGLRACMSSIEKALQDFAKNPDSETHANIVATEFKNITQTLKQLNDKLGNVAKQQKYDLELSTTEVNKMFQQIAGLNKTISEDLGVLRENAYYGPNELLDQRNLLLDQLSQYGDMSYTTNADGTVTVNFAGVEAVNGNKAKSIQMETNDDNTVRLSWVESGEPLALTTGALKGSTDYINGRGPARMSGTESVERGVLFYQDKLDTFARQLAHVVNNSIPDELDADGNVVGYRQLLGGLSDTPDADGKYDTHPDNFITAGNLTLSNEWAADSKHIIFRPGDKADGTFVQKMIVGLTSEKHTFSFNGLSYEGSFMDYIKDYSATLGEDIAFSGSRHTASSSIASDLQDSRDEVSGVVVDEEVANMMLYNKSLQAASRLMTTMDEALDVLINKTGLVGR